MKNRKITYVIIAIVSALAGLFFILLQLYSAAAGPVFLALILWLNSKKNNKDENPGK
jgi:hypothetical protein